MLINITASYLDPHELLLSRSERQSRLAGTFGFKCQCESCGKPASRSARSDRRLSQYSTIKATWDSMAIEDLAFEQNAALTEVERAAQLLYSEKQYQEAESVLEQRFKVYAAWGEGDKAKRAARRLKRFYRVVCGRTAAEESDAAAWSRRPELSADWGVCLRVNKVGVSFQGPALV